MWISVFALLLAFMYICPISVKAANLRISSKKVTLTVGETKKIAVKNNIRKKKVTWKSSNNGVATVSSSGKIRAKRSGNAVIYAKVNGKTLKCKVTVKKKEKSIFENMQGKYFVYNDSEYLYEIHFSKNTKNIYIGIWDKSGKGGSLEDFSFNYKNGKFNYTEKGYRSGRIYNIKLSLNTNNVKLEIQCKDAEYSWFNFEGIFQFAGYLNY